MPALDIPRTACEITPERVIAARANEAGSIEVLSSRTLPAGALVPGLAGANVATPGAVRDAVADALASVGGSRDIIAVLPDAAVRIVLLDFETLPEKRQDADPVVRFRLKKSLPFDVDEAALSYDTNRSNGKVKVVAAVTPLAVRQEYEGVFRDAGFHPGVVVPSMLSALGPVDAMEPTLILKVDSNTTSVAIVQNNDLLLYRTLENARTGIAAEALADDIYPSLVFFQDTYGSNVTRILLAGLATARDLGPALEAQTGARVSDLVSGSQSSTQGNLPASLTASVVGALLGA